MKLKYGSNEYQNAASPSESLHMNSQTYFGHCYCGKVRFAAAGPVRNLCVCHCESCRRAAGAAFVAWGTVNADQFKILSGDTSIVRMSAEVERTFCRNCGSSLTYSHTLRAGDLDFTLVLLDDPSALVPRMHIWVEDKLPWLKLSDGLPQYQTLPSPGSN
jgi:hypothetical protein